MQLPQFDCGQGSRKTLFSPLSAIRSRPAAIILDSSPGATGARSYNTPSQHKPQPRQMFSSVPLGLGWGGDPVVTDSTRRCLGGRVFQQPTAVLAHVVESPVPSQPINRGVSD